MAKDTTCLLSEKEEWIAIDYARMICALLIVSIHLPVFASVDVELSYYFNHVICRIAVPFFFITSGFFIADKIDSKGTAQYVKHVILLYVLYNLLYIPQSFYRVDLAIVDRQFFVDAVKQLLLVGGYMQLWYLIALAFAVVALKVMVNKFGFADKTLALVGVGLYIIGVVGNSYREILINLDISIITQYYVVFATMRNGLFFGIPFVSAGYLIKKNSCYIKDIGYLKWTVLFIAGMFLEAVMIYLHFDSGDKDMMFFTFPATICFFLTVCFIRQNKEKMAWLGNRCRKYSVMLFCLHIFVYFYLNRYMFEHGYYMAEHTVIRYMMVVAVTLLISAVIIESSKFKIFGWLKVFY